MDFSGPVMGPAEARGARRSGERSHHEVRCEDCERYGAAGGFNEMR